MLCGGNPGKRGGSVIRSPPKKFPLPKILQLWKLSGEKGLDFDAHGGVLLNDSGGT